MEVEVSRVEKIKRDKPKNGDGANEFKKDLLIHQRTIEKNTFLTRFETLVLKPR